ncbi:MAG TPA: oxidoreductase, partial [Bacteroidales bacterium]|nr:oxidoreductase [Bacteroidales bacterium]
ARVYHVDSVKQVINHANENAELSKLSKIHWIVEDAMKFVKRQVSKGMKYNGIILDPPAFGRGPNGEKWILEKHLNGIIKDCSKILKEEKSFLILNLYSLGWSPILAENLIKQNFDFNELEFGELVINDSFDKKLPLGIYARFLR